MATVGVTDVDFHLPGGNWLGKQIRGIHEDSRGVFPEPAPDHFRPTPPGQMISTMKLDYVRLVGRPTRSAPAAPRGAGGRGGTGGVSAAIRNIPHSSEMFMSWKIPSRLMNDGALNKDSYESPEDILAQVTKLRLDPPRDMAYKPSKTSNPTHTTHYLPPRHEMHDRVRTGLPDIYKTRSQMASRADSTKTLTQKEQLFLGRTVQPAMQMRAKSWLRQAPKDDRKVIEQALQIADKKRVKKTLDKTLLPNPKMAAYKWLETANEKDREVALKFFQSVAGTKLMGDNNEEQQHRLSQVLQTLEKGRPLGALSLPKPREPRESEGGSNLQYIRLLTADTRAKRWMHTTWHHLPEYKTDNPVENKTSMYTQPHKPIPRHYVIHPNLG